MKRTRGVGAVSIRPVLWVLLAGAAFAVLALGAKVSQGREARELVALEQAAKADALADQAKWDAIAARAEDMKAHPEKYRASFKKTIQPTEQVSMAWAKGEQTLATAYNGSLWANLLYDDKSANPTVPVQSVSTSALGGSVTLSKVAYGEGVAGAIFALNGEDTEDLRTAVLAWLDAAAAWDYFVVYSVAVASPTTQDVEYTVVGYHIYEVPGDDPIATWEGPEELTVTWTIGLTGAYRKAQVTENIPSGQTYLRDVRQRTGTGHWFADADTVVTVAATVGSTNLSAQGNYGAGSETDLTEAMALGVTPYISYNYAPEVGVDYGTVTLYAGSGTDVPINIDHWTFYKVSGGDGNWHWMGETTSESYDPTPDAGDVIWRAFGSGNTLHLQAGAAYTTGGDAFSALLQCNNVDIYLALKKANGEPWGETNQDYGSYDSSAGHPFEIGRYRASGVTAADVSMPPSNDPIEVREVWTYGNGGIPDDQWRYLTNILDGVTVRLRGAWCVANNEDVDFTDPSTMENVTPADGTDILQALTFHPLDGELDAPPWRDDWITWQRTERDLDVPPGAASRPSAWTGSGGANVSGDTWTIPANGGTVERTLATRRRNRLIRMNAHLWTGSGDQQEVSDDWPLMTRANLAIETTGDDPKWWDPEAEPWSGEEVGVTYEDITDWRMFSCVRLHATGATANQTVQLRLTYRTLSGYNPYYTGARWKYGPGDGEFEASWSSQQTATISATLNASTGYAVFDLAPDGGSDPYNLELVEKIEFIFAGSGTEDGLTFTAWETVPYSGAGTDEITGRVAHLCASDYWGVRCYVDGMPNYQPTYLYALDAERVEVGFKNQQDAQHNPDSELTDDLRSLKELARIVNEMQWGECLLEPTYQTATIADSLTDADSNVLAVPKCGDFDSANENGFCIHVGTDLDCFFPVHSVYCTCILQGGARGILKSNGVRQTNETDAVTLLYSDDNGTTKIAVQDRSTDAQGAFRVWSGREKTPRVYYLRINGTDYPIGSFVNVEEVWSSLAGAIASAGGWYLDMTRHPFGNVIWTAWISGNDIKVAETSTGKTTLATPVTVDSSGDYDTVAIETDGAVFYIDARNSTTHALYRWYSEDHGQTWTGPTAIA